jgi:alpha-tubulin suppressor-like RCC1 family protein
LKKDGSLWVWGTNSFGQLGLDNTINYSSPVQVAGTWVDVGTASGSGFAVDSSGRLWSAGASTQGQGGRGNTIFVSSWTQIGAATDWARVVGGNTSVAAIKKDGSLYGWGNNSTGVIGNNAAISTSSPVLATNKTWSDIEIGNFTALGKDTSGNFWMWGRGGEGQFGDSTLINRSSPVLQNSQWVAMRILSNNTLYIKKDGTLWGTGTTASVLSPGYAGTNVSSPILLDSTRTWLNFPSIAYGSTGFAAVIAIAPSPSPAPTKFPSAMSMPVPATSASPSASPTAASPLATPPASPEPATQPTA